MDVRTWFLLLTLSIAVGAGASSWAERPQSPWRNSLRPEGEVGSELTLAREGQSNYRILLPAEPTTQEIKAATELRRWLGEMTGVELQVVRESWKPRFGPHYISVGRTRALNRLFINDPLGALTRVPAASVDLGDEGYGIQTDGQRLYLWGGRTRGTINAVLALLEEDLGCRWYTKDHSKIPERKNLTFRPIERLFVPKLALRDPFYFVAFDEEWSLRNKTNAPRAAVREEWGGHMDYGGRFVHTFHSLMPPDKYYKEHPEYYMLDAAGNRSTQQLCTTNPEVIRLVIEEVKRFLHDNPNTEIVSVSKIDGGQTCLCDNCKALDTAEGTNMAALLYMVNTVAEAIEEEYPNVVVSTLAYLETVGVPKTMRPRKNVAIRLCNDTVGAWTHPFTPAEDCQFASLMKNWSAVHDKIYVWDYTVNFSHYLAPMPNMDFIARNIRFMVDNHAVGIMTQGAYQGTGERDQMRSWVIAKMMWDPSRDLSELMRDFIRGHFGKAAPAIEEYNRLLEQQGEQFKEILAQPAGGIRYGMDNPFLSRDFLKESNEIFDRAEKLADGEEILRRVQRARLPIMYVELERGPEFVGDGYDEILRQFETAAEQAGVTHLMEIGPSDFSARIQTWKAKWDNR